MYIIQLRDSCDNASIVITVGEIDIFNYGGVFSLEFLKIIVPRNTDDSLRVCTTVESTELFT